MPEDAAVIKMDWRIISTRSAGSPSPAGILQQSGAGRDLDSPI
jgi:hypothetical protein